MSSTERFSNRVRDYVLYRPSYPRAVIDAIAEFSELSGEARVADIGSGTGIFTELLLERWGQVFAVEPNAPMREAAEELLNSKSGFHSVAATAEATGLDVGSIDLITVAQAFHWFDSQACRTEFRRIGVPSAPVAILWNERRVDVDAFHQAYETLLLKHANDYERVDHRQIGKAKLAAFFETEKIHEVELPNVQSFDFQGLRGRLCSSSYMPGEGDAGYENMMADLRGLFERFQDQGAVEIKYDTRLHISRLMA